MPYSSIPNHQQIITFEKTKETMVICCGENVTINHAGLIQRADNKETRMRMRPACILDGEILGEVFSGGEAMLDINCSPSLFLILWDSHHHWQCLF